MMRLRPLKANCHRARPRRAERGATAVETAFVLPLLLLLLLGIADFGRAMWMRNVIQATLDDTGRYAMLNGSLDSDALSDYFNTRLESLYGSPVTLTFTNSTQGTTIFTTIVATYNFQPVSSYLPLGAITMSSTTAVPRS
jgi:Flp pilus assembly protein TadG